jgi:hypothetical protein
MPVVRRGSHPVLVRRRYRGLGAPNTLAAGGLTEASCATAGEILDTATGFCMLPSYGKPADIAAAAQYQSVNVSAAAPPVYVSTFVPSTDPSQWQQTSYAVNQTAAITAQQVNDENGRRFQTYQTAMQNWVGNGSQGSPPAPPAYVTFSDYWSGTNLGPIPGSVSTAPPGTPIPQSGYLTGALAPGGPGFAITGTKGLAPAAQSNAPAPAVVTTQAPASQSNAPAPSAVAPGGILQQLQTMVTAGSNSTSSPPNWFDGIPNWLILAGAGGIGLLFLIRGNRG